MAEARSARQPRVLADLSYWTQARLGLETKSRETSTVVLLNTIS